MKSNESKEATLPLQVTSIIKEEFYKGKKTGFTMGIQNSPVDKSCFIYLSIL